MHSTPSQRPVVEVPEVQGQGVTEVVRQRKILHTFGSSGRPVGFMGTLRAVRLV
jgi:hypothetical protein